MGIFGDARREFIARPDTTKSEIFFKWPDRNIRKFSQLTVAQDELAVFTRDGKIVATFPSGRHTLDSSEFPILADLIDLATGGNFFLSELYFISTREHTNLPFGGVVDDVVDPATDLAVGLRVFGEYALIVADAKALICNLVGTRNIDSNDEITDWAKHMLLKCVRIATVTLIQSEQWQLLGLAAHTKLIEAAALAQVAEELQAYGLRVTRLGNMQISLSDADQRMLKDFRRDQSYTKLAGGFGQYGAGAALRGIGEGAAQGGVTANNAVAGMGLTMGSLLGAAAAGISQKQTLLASAPVGVLFCSACGTPSSTAEAAFCSSCGHAFGA